MKFNPATTKWEEYIGEIRYNLFLCHQIKNNSIIVEIAPGTLPKIGIGIAKLNFIGTIYLIEPDEKSLESIVIQYKNLMPNANIIGVLAELKDACKYLPKKVDVICSNHPLDDMIISYATYATTTKKYYGEYYGKNNFSLKVRNNIIKSEKKLRENNLKILKDWNDLIIHTNPNVLIISQYKSYYYQSNGILIPDRLSYEILQTLKSIYQNENDISLILKKFNQNPLEWYVANISAK